jgi:glycogen debranching enzyme
MGEDRRRNPPARHQPVVGFPGVMIDEPSPYSGTTPATSLMATEGVVTLVEGQSFCLSGRSGDMNPDFPHGLFVYDTRMLSRWELRLNRHRLEPLAVEVPQPFGATLVGRGAPALGHADADTIVFRHRHVGSGLRERIEVSNHGLDPVSFLLELQCDADFADLFEVKESRVVPRGVYSHRAAGNGLRFEHRLNGRTRSVTIDPSRPAKVEGTTLGWQGRLDPGTSWEICIGVTGTVNGVEIEPRFTCGGHDPDSLPQQRLAHWRAGLPIVETDLAPLAETVTRAAEDLGALRIFDPERPNLPILAAGAPWYMTVFGRDSLLTAWMTLMADSSLAGGVLETLARFQGTDVNRETEEEPGKILHEMRFGSAVKLALGGGNVYYGTIDATPLFVMLLGELQRWDGHSEVVERLLPHADRALAWIEEFGDSDGDGYVEYRRTSKHGLTNQGWKDSWDAIRHLDGRLADAPVALCEVQGYVYAAYVARARLAREAGDMATFERCKTKALELRRRFNRDFWVEEHGWYALGLDGDNRRIEALASNMGHCLWTGIVDPERAPLVADRLLSPEMFSGLGVRTLASSMKAYNPVSYHNGSIWPHDNALCAAGLARYGLVDHARRIIDAQIEVARSHDGRLPELFAGFGVDELSVPASYPTSCSPQAWAAASPLLWLRTLLRLDPWASRSRVWLDPALPTGAERLMVSGIKVAGRRLTVAVEEGDIHIVDSGGLDIVHHARPALTAAFDPVGD